jgi:hypothetical protein
MPSSTTRPGTLAWAAPRDPAGRRRTPPAPRPSSRATCRRSRDPREHGEVEVHHVPAREHVGIELAHAAREGGEQLPLRPERRRPSGQASLPGSAASPRTRHAVEPDREHAARGGSVSMSSERTSSRGVQSAGASSGPRRRGRDRAGRPSPRISRPPRIPRSMRKRIAKRTSAS